MTDRGGISPAEEPLGIGDIVHISATSDSDARPHRYACEVEDVHEADDLDEYSYTVRSIVQERTLPSRYSHHDLIPSPRGYQNIDALLGDNSVKGERLLGKFKRPDLEVMNSCLSVVDPEADATKDWLNELKKNDVDRINSIFAEMVLLYHLRTTYEHDRVSLNASIGKKDFDIRVTTEEEDVWIEVTKPDFADSLSNGFRWGLPETTTNSIDRKLKSKFEEARENVPEHAVLILAIYFEEQLNQSIQVNEWLEEDYYDIGEFSDAWLSFEYLAGETEIGFESFTIAGERCRSLFERMADG